MVKYRQASKKRKKESAASFQVVPQKCTLICPLNSPDLPFSAKKKSVKSTCEKWERFFFFFFPAKSELGVRMSSVTYMHCTTY